MIKKLVSLSIAGFMVLSIASALVLPSQANATGNGNNGTLKVHEFGTPSGTENNDPKVCKFNFEGFSFDKAQSGYIHIATQGGQKAGVVVKTLSFGATNDNGYAATSYVTIANGHYKATLYGKSTGNPAHPDLKDVKAKSKVFKVNCESTTTPATPTKPTTPNNPEKPGDVLPAETENPKGGGAMPSELPNTGSDAQASTALMLAMIAALGGIAGVVSRLFIDRFYKEEL